MLVIVHSMTTMWWLDDLVRLFAHDVRVQLVFTYAAVSAFTLGVEDELDALGGAVVPWEQAITEEFDLALTAGNEGPLHEIRCPMIVFPHGPGYTKSVNTPFARFDTGDLDPSAPPLTVAVPHRADTSRFAGAAGVQPVVTGDLVWQSLQDGLPFSQRYRAALGVEPGQRLIVLSSTWGPHSLFNTHPRLAHELLRQLPADEVVVAYLVHANVWVGHGPQQVRLWLRTALDAGLRLVPHRAGWRGTTIAADLVVGDHGSVTTYAACLGTPVLLGSRGGQEPTAGTPLAEFVATAPAFTSVEEAVHWCRVTPPARDELRHERLRLGTFDSEADPAMRTRRLIYEHLALSEPSHAARRRMPDVAEVAAEQPRAHLVQLLSATASPSTTSTGLVVRVTLSRHAAVLDPPTTPGASAVVVVESSECDMHMRRCADVVLVHANDSSADFPHASTIVTALPEGRWLATRTDGRAYAISENSAAAALLIATAHHLADAHAHRAGTSLSEERAAFEIEASAGPRSERGVVTRTR